MTTINVSERNWKRLTKLKSPGDTHDDVVEMLLDDHGVELDSVELTTANGGDGGD